MCISIKYWLLTKSDTWMQFLLILENLSEKTEARGKFTSKQNMACRITSIALRTFCINLLKKITAIQPLMWHWSQDGRIQNPVLYLVQKPETLSPLRPIDFAPLPASLPQLLHLAAGTWLLLPISSAAYLFDTPARPSSYQQHTIPHQKLSWVIETWNKHFNGFKVSSRKSHWSRERRSCHGAQEENMSLLRVVNCYVRSCFRYYSCSYWY